MPEEEYRALTRAARRRGRPISQLVRESLKRTLAEDEGSEDPERRIAAVLRFARYGGPTGDVEQLLEEIERGRGLT
jgi:hypothetical protein